LPPLLFFLSSQKVFFPKKEIFINLNLRKGFQLFDPILQGGILKGKKFENFI